MSQFAACVFTYSKLTHMKGEKIMLWVGIFLTAIMAGTVQTATGFGAGVLLLLVFPVFFDMLTAPAISSSICIGLSTLLAIKYRKFFKAEIAVLPTLIYTSMSILFVRFAKMLDLKVLTIIFGVFLIALSCYYLLFQNKIKITHSHFSEIFCSGVSGIFGGLFAIGGPLIALYMLERTKSWEEYLGNLQFLFMTTTIFSFVARICNGLYTIDMLPYTLIGLVGIFTGKRFGQIITSKLQLEGSKKVIYCCVGIAGLITIAKQLF